MDVKNVLLSEDFANGYIQVQILSKGMKVAEMFVEVNLDNNKIYPGPSSINPYKGYANFLGNINFSTTTVVNDTRSLKITVDPNFMIKCLIKGTSNPYCSRSPY